MKYYDLKNKNYVNLNDDSKALAFAYNNVIGRFFLKIAIC